MVFRTGLQITLLWIITQPSLATQIYVYDKNGAIPLDKLQYSLWDLSERTGIELTYGGVVAVGYVPDSIVVRVGSFQEWDNLKADANAAQTHDDAGCEIVFNPYYILFHEFSQGLLLHEISHCAGFWPHLSDPIDTLFPIAGEYGLTQSDSLAILAHPTWPPARPPSLCHAVLDADWNLLIPEISGFRAKLVYVGENTWKVQASGLTPNPQGCAGFKVENGKAILPEVKLYGGMRYSAVLESVDTGWRLVSALPL